MNPALREYTPGVCNIGPAEIKRRRAVGIVGLVVTVALLALFIALGVSNWWRLAIFLPATASASGFLQAGLHFCANFGMKGIFNVTPSLGQHDTVAQAEYRLADRRKAQQIIVMSLVIGLVITIIALVS